MDYSQPFSVLNEKLRPRVTSSEKLYSSLNRLEDREFGSLRNKSSFQRLTVLPVEPGPRFPVAEPEELKSEPECSGEQEDLVCGSQEDGSYADLLAKDSCLISGLDLKDVDEEALLKDDGGTTKSGETDSPGELTSEEMRDPSKLAPAGEEGSTVQACYIDGTLPDLLKNGRPLGRRRTLGHVTDTLKEVRREVELSRRRSIRLKAQVEKLQESRAGPGWSQHRERVTEEVLSILRLLHPLTEPESSQPEASDEENRLDAALKQLQNVARKLAISQTKKEFKSERNGDGDSAILQQALRDRDEAIEKKKAMEAEVLRSKTEMMALNNQLLEAAQKRLELSLELEAWKEDFQLILQQQIKSQQQAEQVQKKPSRLGILKRSKPTTQRPVNFPLSTAAPPTTNSNQIFMNRSSSADCAAPTFGSLPTSGTRTWREKLRKGKSNRHGDQDATDQDLEGRRDDDGFQVVCLD